jgi:hypothetical protein
VSEAKLIVNLTRPGEVCRGEMADRPLTRMRGLMGRKTLPVGEGVLITPAPAIHTGFMRFPIDALFLDKEMRVLSISEHLVPWRMASQRGARSVLELVAGETARLGLRVGDILGFGDDDAAAVSAVPTRQRASVHSLERLTRVPVGAELSALEREGALGLAGSDVIIASLDRRFSAAASVLLSRRNCSVTTVAHVCELAAIVGEADVAVVDCDEVQAGEIEAIPDHIGVVLVADEPESISCTDRAIAKWGPFEDLVTAIENADPRRIRGRAGSR